MSKPDKIRVAVLYGGRSGEHEVSLVSATNVIENLDRSLFDVVPVGIDKQGAWFLGDDIFQKELNSNATKQLIRLHSEEERMLFDPDLIGKRMHPVQPGQLMPQAKHAERIFDVVFPVIHGPLCEDGTIQGLLELTDLPYVGCGVLASSVGMDKDISKRLMMSAGIPVPAFIVIKRGHWDQDPAHFTNLVTEQLSYPVFVKPVNTGSSVGVHKVKSAEELALAMSDAYKYDTKVIVEQGLDVREIEIAVLESEDYCKDPLVSVAGEVTPSTHHEFYSYASKYLDDKGAELCIPAAITPELQEEAREMAKKIFAVLDCEGMARIDLFLERTTNRLYFNEINTIPGFTQISMYPKLMAASGVEYSELLTRLISLAIKRHARKSQLSREYVAS
jgi:D-alanine-D-alanine ligase